VSTDGQPGGADQLSCRARARGANAVIQRTVAMQDRPNEYDTQATDYSPGNWQAMRIRFDKTEFGTKRR